MKEKQENDKIGSKPDKNGKRGKAQQCRKPIKVEKEEKKEKIQREDTRAGETRVTKGGDTGTRAIVADRQHDGMHHTPFYASFLHEEYSQRKVNFRTLKTEQSELADVLIPMSSVLKVHARFENTLYGYFLGKKVAYPVVERYILNAWQKYGVRRVTGDKKGFFFIQFFMQLVWKGYWSMVLADGLSAIATRLGTSIMLDSCTSTTCMKAWGRIDYAQALVGIRAGGALKDTMGGTSNDGFQAVQRKDFRGPLGSKKGAVGNLCLVKQHMPKSAYRKKTTSTPGSNSFSALEEDNEKAMDDTRKKMEAPPKKTPRKTAIWSGRKAGSLKRNVAFSPEMKVCYFDRDDMDFDDMGQAVEEVEHENAYNDNGLWFSCGY
nr:hypothetical protein [Tanacetum cinerariifolium]